MMMPLSHTTPLKAEVRAMWIVGCPKPKSHAASTPPHGGKWVCRFRAEDVAGFRDR
jgi:hypothetical protein